MELDSYLNLVSAVLNFFSEAYVEAYVSLATNDSYAMGALALAKSIRDSGSSRRLGLMVSSGVSREMR